MKRCNFNVNAKYLIWKILYVCIVYFPNILYAVVEFLFDHRIHIIIINYVSAFHSFCERKISLRKRITFFLSFDLSISHLFLSLSMQLSRAQVHQ